MGNGESRGNDKKSPCTASTPKNDWKIFGEVLTCHICDKSLLQKYSEDSKGVSHPEVGFSVDKATLRH